VKCSSAFELVYIAKDSLYFRPQNQIRIIPEEALVCDG
jgi:hypothetical protein